MSSISGISSSFIQNYTNFGKKSELSTKEMFQVMSLEVGGDSDSITKEQLDNYLEEANSGVIDVSSSALDSLTELQDNWDTISGGKDSVTASDLADYNDILLDVVAGDAISSANDLNISSSPTDEVYSYLIESAGFSNINDVTSEDLSNVLKSLLSDGSDSNDGYNSDIIDTLTNLIAAYSSVSTVEAEG